MANSSTPFGFRPYGHQDGSAPTMGLQEFTINSSDTQLYFTGDLVVLSTAGANSIDVSIGSTSAAQSLGVFWGCQYYSAAAQRVVWSRYFPGSVGANATVGRTKCWVITDPEMQFIGASAGTFGNTEIGFNTIIVTSQSSLGNTATGQSAMIVSTAIANSASYPWRIVDVYANKAIPGAWGAESTTYNWVILAPNAWVRNAGTVGVSS